MSLPKTRRLPITDLARISVQPYELRRPALMQVKGGGGGANYNPTRGQFPGIVNRQPGMFPADRDSWSVLKESISRACRSSEEIELNLPVAKQLFDYCDENMIRALELEGFPISFSVGPKLQAWSPALFIYGDKITIPFLDLRRRGKRLTREGQRFIFSLQHHALRVNNPDYADVSLEIFKFSDNDLRTIRPIVEDNRWLYSYDQLENMICETQLLWFDVLAGREDEAKKSGGEKGSLL